MPANTKTPKSKDLNLRRPTSWDEAYLRYPRAYLYISTSMEYSLSFGRLFDEALLPEQVRHVRSIVFGPELSPTIGAPHGELSKPADSRLETDWHIKDKEDDALILGLEPITVLPQTGRTSKDEDERFCAQDNQAINKQTSTPDSCDSDPTITELNIDGFQDDDQSYDSMNLDYYDLNPAFAGNMKPRLLFHLS